MFLKIFSVLLWLIAATVTQAGVVINGTRVIYREADGETVVQLLNKGEGPLLVQSWIDDGDAQAKIESLKVPFTLMPSVARIDPAKGQAIRVLLTRKELPTDRESLLWFNVLEIPPMPSRQLAKGDNLLQFSFRTRIKFFYRPAGLGSSPEDALKQLRFAIGHDAKGELTVRVSNPSPYHITFRSISLRHKQEGPALAELGNTYERMVSPAGELTLPLHWLDKAAAASGKLSLFFTAINDQGGDSRLQQGLLETDGRG
ncbi:hypothetical protein AXE65_02655 [Ventosimonas gracilis]|uniref:Molecular chaperone n=1 Tax=Ventosimonas gracilis TaxID=1680762 RepID=A0A139SUD6_9GAMM|nr:fimbria/pilus periplasmic chaperone [Ventosimonas gracilis]KXU38144.1 hypothetical protein AXE65_02655 [Ventosimonas gracilis]